MGDGEWEIQACRYGMGNHRNKKQSRRDRVNDTVAVM